MMRSAFLVVGLLIVVFLGLLRGYWYPGITGRQKAEILLTDDKYPNRALRGISLLDDSTLSALALTSENFKKLSLSGRAMVTRIAVCESGQRFVSFAKS